jgi:hypothetical protein
MVKVTLPSGEYLFTKVPNDWVPVKFSVFDARNNAIWGTSDNVPCVLQLKDNLYVIPYDDAGTKPEIIGTTNNLTLEQIEEIFGIADFNIKSLISALNNDIEKNYLILKIPQ